MKEPHTFASLEEFRNNNENWHSAEMWYQQAQASVQGTTDDRFKWTNEEFNDTLATTIVFGDE